MPQQQSLAVTGSGTSQSNARNPLAEMILSQIARSGQSAQSHRVRNALDATMLANAAVNFGLGARGDASNRVGGRTGRNPKQDRRSNIYRQQAIAKNVEKGKERKFRRAMREADQVIADTIADREIASNIAAERKAAADSAATLASREAYYGSQPEASPLDALTLMGGINRDIQESPDPGPQMPRYDIPLGADPVAEQYAAQNDDRFAEAQEAVAQREAAGPPPTTALTQIAANPPYTGPLAVDLMDYNPGGPYSSDLPPAPAPIGMTPEQAQQMQLDIDRGHLMASREQQDLENRRSTTMNFNMGPFQRTGPYDMTPEQAQQMQLDIDRSRMMASREQQQQDMKARRDYTASMVDLENRRAFTMGIPGMIPFKPPPYQGPVGPGSPSELRGGQGYPHQGPLGPGGPSILRGQFSPPDPPALLRNPGDYPVQQGFYYPGPAVNPLMSMPRATYGSSGFASYGVPFR